MIYYQLLELFHRESVLTPDGLAMIERWVSMVEDF
jgi:anthranilate/para-aminobenzoate synthase component II